VACVVHVMLHLMCTLYHAACMLQAMTGRLLSVARDVSGARERAASPSKLPVAAAKQVTDALHTWSGWQVTYSQDNVHWVASTNTADCTVAVSKSVSSMSQRLFR